MRLPALLCAAMLCAPWARADDNFGKAFGAFKKLKGGGPLKIGGTEIPIKDSQVEAVAKSAKALRKSFEEITEKEEYFIGRAVAARILSRYPALEEESLNRYAQAVLQAVAATSGRPEIYAGYHAQIVRSEELNAMAAPGGFVFLTTGLLRALKSEDELAAVLAHELGHIAGRHGLKTIKKSRLTEAFQVIGSEAAREFGPRELSRLTEAFGGAVDDIVNDLLISGYSRDKEFDADRDGAIYAAGANYDPRALAAFLERLPESGGGWNKTHPKTSARLKELRKAAVRPSPDHSPRGRTGRFAKQIAKLQEE